MARFLWRLTGAMVLNPKAYEDVEADESATVQALGVVLLSSLAAGAGALGLRSGHSIGLVVISLLALALAMLASAVLSPYNSRWAASSHGRCARR